MERLHPYSFPTTLGAYSSILFVSEAFITKLNISGSALIFSTFIGGDSFDFGSDIKIDNLGGIYIAGYTKSIDFPTSAGAYSSYLSDTVPNCSYYGGGDIFVAKLNSSGSTLIYSTYIGGKSCDEVNSLAIDIAGNAYITGYTESENYPTTLGAFDRTINSQYIPYCNGGSDIIVTKLNGSGTALVFSTLIGGSEHQDALSIVVDSYGNSYITGWTNSPDFPVTSGSFDTLYHGFGDAFVTKINSSGSALIYSCFLGGTYSNFGWPGGNHGKSIAIDSSGNAYITGYTESIDFPTTPGAFNRNLHTTNNSEYYDAFVSKLNSSGSALIYSTFIGGDSVDYSHSIVLDKDRNAYILGSTRSRNFPVSQEAFNSNFSGGFYDIFLTKLDSSGASLNYSSYIGGASDEYGYGLALDKIGNAYVTGFSLSSNYPTTPGAFSNLYAGTGGIWGNIWGRCRSNKIFIMRFANIYAFIIKLWI